MNRRGARLFDRIAIALSVFAFVWSCLPDDVTLRSFESIPAPITHAIIGCWRFDRGQSFLAERIPVGSVVLFDTSTGRRWSSDTKPPVSYVASVLPFDTANSRSVRASGWGLSSDDDRHIRLWLGDGFTGLRFRLKLSDSVLTGTVQEYADFGFDLAFRHRVRARLVACPHSPSR